MGTQYTRISFSFREGYEHLALSHAFCKIWLQDGVQGEGEIFKILRITDEIIALRCLGKEKKYFLSHKGGQVKLEYVNCAESEHWILKDQGDKCSLHALGKESGKFLSHSSNNVSLSEGIKGDGELWIKMIHTYNHYYR